MKRYSAIVGTVIGTGTTKTEAKERAVGAASRILNQLDRARPQIVAWYGSVCLVFCLFTTEGEVLWGYTNPRTLEELSQDSGRERMGTGGYWQNASEARSAALSHMIQNDPRGITTDLPNDLTQTDRQRLADLRELHATAAA